VHLWFRHKRIPLPAAIYDVEGRLIKGKLPVYKILHISTNPICWRLCLRAHRQPRQHRDRPQEGGARLALEIAGENAVNPRVPDDSGKALPRVSVDRDFGAGGERVTSRQGRPPDASRHRGGGSATGENPRVW
jgi:hypothetical protein